MGLNEKSSTIYIIDFGLSKRYFNPKTGKHISYKNNKSLTGTARYASINTHMGIEQSRRDDLEALSYILLYFLRGNLPWQGLLTKTKEDKYRKIMQCKMATSTENLCKGFPNELQIMINYTRNLKFEEDPNYEYMNILIRTMTNTIRPEESNIYDWSIQDTTIEKHKTFVHLRERQIQLARRHSLLIMRNNGPGKISERSLGSKINESGVKAYRDGILDDSSHGRISKICMESIGTSNEKFNKKKKVQQTMKNSCCLVL